MCIRDSDSSARHKALELLDAVMPLPARTQLVEAINARIRLSCLLMPPDGVPEFYSPTALHARSMLLQRLCRSRPLAHRAAGALSAPASHDGSVGQRLDKHKEGREADQRDGAHEPARLLRLDRGREQLH